MANIETNLEEEKEIKNEEKRISYTVPDDNGNETHEIVWLNGVRYGLKKGETVKVPAGVKEILERRNALRRKQRDALRDAKNQGKGM